MYKEADILFAVKKKSLLARAIRWFTRIPSEEKTKTNHVAMFIDSDTIIEALHKVVTTTKEEWFKKNKHLEVWRNTELSDEDRLNIANEIVKYKNESYGYFKILTQALDGLISKIANKNIIFFRNFNFTNQPICSWLVAKVYQDTVSYKFDMNYDYVAPDDIRDHIINSEKWKLINKK